MRNKRHTALRPLTSEHQTTLILVDRIREGLHQEVEPERIFQYSKWFWKNYIEPHFELEKRCVFPLLGNNNVRVKRALANHRRLARLFDQKTDLTRSLNRIEEELGVYIRFEERILYNEIQAVASSKELARIEACHQGLPFSDSEWKDRFWAN